MGSGGDVGGDEGSGSWEVGLVVTAARAEGVTGGQPPPVVTTGFSLAKAKRAKKARF